MIREHLPAVIIGVVFAALASTYAIVTPLFEASDEISHYPAVHHIATTGTLPVQEPGIRTRFEQEGSQPPLYYLIGAALTGWIDTSDIDEVRWRNPHGKIGLSHHDDNKNMVIHTEAENWPWQGTVLAVHIVRFFSVALGTGSVILGYLLLREMWPGQRWVHVLALSLIAFNPMFLFITGSVNNDNLTVFLATWVLLLVARLLRDGLTTQRAATIAVLFALASLTKVSGLTLAPIIGLAMLIHALRSGEWRQVFAMGFTMITVWLILAGWWYARNLVLYNELTGIQMHIEIVGGRESTVWQVITEEYLSFWTAYWAWFGGVNILADQWVYNIYRVITGGAIMGAVVWFVLRLRERAWERMLVPGTLALQILVVIGGVINWTTITYGSQGRLVFPVIAVISGISAWGLLFWVPQRWQPVGVGVVSAPMAVIAVMAPFWYIAPTYAPPPTVDEVPAEATPIGAVWGPLELVAVRTESVTVAAGGFVPVTAYWRLNEATEINYSTYYHAFGQDLEEIGKVDAFPGGGALPTSRMEPGVIIEDRIRIPLARDIHTPTVARVQIGAGLREGSVYRILAARTTEGRGRPTVVVQAGVVYPRDLSTCPTPDPADSVATFFDFARYHYDPVELTASPMDTITLGGMWAPYGATETPLRVFVHLLNAEGEIVAQADGPPLGGDYPTTLWRVACPTPDSVAIDLATVTRPGTYQLVMGLYDPQTGERAPALDGEGTPYPDFAVPLGTVQIEWP